MTKADDARMLISWLTDPREILEPCDEIGLFTCPECGATLARCDARGRWRCEGCGREGDSVTGYALKHGTDEQTATAVLALRGGIEVDGGLIADAWEHVLERLTALETAKETESDDGFFFNGYGDDRRG